MSKVAKVIQNWGTLNTGLNDLTLVQVVEAINAEVAGKARQTILGRLIARYGKLAAQDMARRVAGKVRFAR